MAILCQLQYDKPGFVPFVNSLFLGRYDIHLSFSVTFEIVS